MGNHNPTLITSHRLTPHHLSVLINKQSFVWSRQCGSQVGGQSDMSQVVRQSDSRAVRQSGITCSQVAEAKRSSIQARHSGSQQLQPVGRSQAVKQLGSQVVSQVRQLDSQGEAVR